MTGVPTPIALDDFTNLRALVSHERAQARGTALTSL